MAPIKRVSMRTLKIQSVGYQLYEQTQIKYLIVLQNLNYNFLGHKRLLKLLKNRWLSMKSIHTNLNQCKMFVVENDRVLLFFASEKVHFGFCYPENGIWVVYVNENKLFRLQDKIRIHFKQVGYLCTGLKF